MCCARASGQRVPAPVCCYGVTRRPVKGYSWFACNRQRVVTLLFCAALPCCAGVTYLALCCADRGHRRPLQGYPSLTTPGFCSPLNDSLYQVVGCTVVTFNIRMDAQSDADVGIGSVSRVGASRSERNRNSLVPPTAEQNEPPTAACFPQMLE